VLAAALGLALRAGDGVVVSRLLVQLVEVELGPANEVVRFFVGREGLDVVGQFGVAGQATARAKHADLPGEPEVVQDGRVHGRQAVAAGELVESLDAAEVRPFVKQAFVGQHCRLQ
jgi:hypothetical protein